MTTKKNFGEKMFMNILTLGMIAVVLTACSDEWDALDDKAPANEKQSDRKELLEPLALNFFDYIKSNDVQILNADTTLISVSRAYADKMGITSFVNHPTGIWQGANNRPFHVRAISEKINGDRYELKVERSGLGEFLVGRSVGFDTSFFINENTSITRGADGDLSSRYTDSENFIHPIGVRVIYRNGEPTELTRGMDGYESEYFTAEELLGMNQTRGWLSDAWDAIKNAAKSVVSGHYFTIDKNGNIINIETAIKADPKFGSEGDTLNLHIKAPVALNLNYKFYLDVDRDYVALPVVNKFDAGVDGRFTFKPQITIGFDKKKKLADVKKEIWNFDAFSFTFAIGPVVFWVDVNPNIYLKFDADVKGSFYGGIKYEYDRTFKGGVTYSNGWNAYGESKEVKNEISFITPTTAFKAETGIGLFLGVDLIIDKVAGPKIAIGPKLSAAAELKVAPMEDEPISLEAEIKAGVYAEMGAKLKVWKFNVAEWDTSMKLVPEKSLWKYEYPKDNADDTVSQVLNIASEKIKSTRQSIKDAI